MSKFILYTFRRCPYAIRARMALCYAGIKVHIREVRLKNKPQALLDASPKATVPILVLPDGRVIDESLDIMRWALENADPDNWYPQTLKLPADLLIDMNDKQFKPILDNYKYPQRSEQQDSLYYRCKAQLFLQHLNEKLSISRYLITDDVNMADVALFPFIRQFAMVDPSWFDEAPYPYLQTWLRQFQTSALFHAVMEKYPPWIEGKEPISVSHTSLK